MQHANTIIVTGASSGLGRELALQLADAGHGVIALGRNQERLDAVAAHSPRITPWPCDLADVGDLPRVAAAVVERLPDVCGLINNAAVQEDVRLDDAGCTAEAISREIAINLTAPMVLTHALLVHLMGRGDSFVLNVTTGLAYVPKRTAAVYSASKAGLHLFTEGLRVQLRGSSLRVMEAVMPVVDTPMTAGRGGRKMPAAEAARAIIEGFDRGRERIHVGKARALPFLLRTAPGIAASIVQRG
jgi:uncharacterized oxidoreductase